MPDDLYQPSLSPEKNEEIRPYDITKLFYAAFFGGVIPTVILGTKNAIYLKVDKIYIALMIVFGAGLALSEIILSTFLVMGQVELDARYFRWLSRIAAVVLYLGYYALTKGRFKRHIITGGEVRPLLKDAIIWILIGSALKIALVFAAGGFGNHVK